MLETSRAARTLAHLRPAVVLALRVAQIMTYTPSKATTPAMETNTPNITTTTPIRLFRTMVEPEGAAGEIVHVGNLQAEGLLGYGWGEHVE